MDETREYFTIRMVAEMTRVHPQTLRYYEKVGLLKPERGKRGARLYRREDVEKVLKIKTLTQDMGVNLAGVEVIFRLTEQIEALRAEKSSLLDRRKNDDEI
ncbi:MAG: MerR family transcriptional regulator [Candidatus Caldatribacteriaceae bacterium]